MGEISAYSRAAPDYPWAAPGFTPGQPANCSLVMLQQTMGKQFQDGRGAAWEELPNSNISGQEDIIGSLQAEIGINWG